MPNYNIQYIFFNLLVRSSQKFAVFFLHFFNFSPPNKFVNEKAKTFQLSQFLGCILQGNRNTKLWKIIICILCTIYNFSLWNSILWWYCIIFIWEKIMTLHNMIIWTLNHMMTFHKMMTFHLMMTFHHIMIMHRKVQIMCLLLQGPAGQWGSR